MLKYVQKPIRFYFSSSGSSVWSEQWSYTPCVMGSNPFRSTMLTKLKYHAHFAKIAIKRKYPEVFPVKMVKTFDVIYESKNGRIHLHLDPIDWLECSLGDLLDALAEDTGFVPKDRMRYRSRGEEHHTFGAVIFLDTGSDSSKGGSQIVKKLWASRDVRMGEKFFSHNSVGIYLNNAS